LVTNAKLATALVLCLVFCGFAQEDSRSESAKSTEDFAARLGEDDGASLAILFGANAKGTLTPCY
jgi:hypothetical protein